MRNDLRLAARSLARAPGFTAVAVLVLALGIAATGAVFSLVSAVFLDGLPYREPAAIAMIEGERRVAEVEPYPLSYLDIEALATAGAFASVSPVTSARPYNLAAGAETEHVSGEMVGEAFFPVLGVPVVAGRALTADEARAHDAHVVVLGHDLWTRRFGARRDAVGATLLLNEKPYTIVGVAAPGFRGLSDEAQLWLPIGLAHSMYGPHYTEMRKFRWLSAVARLRPGTNPAQAQGQAQRQLEVLAARLEREHPADNERIAFRATTLLDAYFAPVRRPLWSLLAAAAFVLLIGCTNIANLLLVRATSHRRQVAVRVALGARRRQLARQALAESLLLVAGGAALGLAGAAWGAHAVAASGLVPLPGWVDVRLDLRVVGATVALAALCAIAFAVVPAVLAARVAPVEGLKDGSRGGTAGRGRLLAQRALIVVEVALALALLHGAGVMGKGLSRWASRDLGFRADSLLTLRVDLTGERYRTNEPAWNLYRRLVESAAARPGVRGVAIEGPGLPTAGRFGVHLKPVGEQRPDVEEMAQRRHHVTPGYFATLGIPLRAGRDFAASDDATAPKAVVIGERLARKLWPGGSALGRQLVGDGPNANVLTVVGVVGDIEYAGLQAGDTEAVDVYFSLYQFPPRSPSVATLFVRGGGATGPLVDGLQASLREIDAGLPFYDVRTMRERLDAQTASSRFLVRLMTAFAALGLVLAAVGIYGVISYAVAQRTREIGIRVALGATRGQVVGGVVRDALRPTAVGVAAGLLAVWWLGRFVAALLYGVSAGDRGTLVVTTVVLVAVATLASWLPALRAARVNPQVALRTE